MTSLSDLYGRRFAYLRLSVTQVCNFSCSYCLPNGYQGCGQQDYLHLDEIRRLAQGFASLGMTKVRITGGEPSVRKDLPQIIQTIAQTVGVKKIALTTNGYRLSQNLPLWKAAGLTALNISVDSLQAERFQQITGHDRLAEILLGIEQSLSMQFAQIKLNAVLLKGINDDELPQWMEYLRARPIAIRFIELMQTGDNLAYFQKHHLSASSVEQQLQAAGWQLCERANDAGPAKEYAHPDYAGRIGLIAPYSKDFCAGCNRLRVTAMGDLRLCLFGELGRPLRELLQADEQHDELVNAIQRAMLFKTPSHLLQQGITGSTPHLASVGG